MRECRRMNMERINYVLKWLTIILLGTLVLTSCHYSDENSRYEYINYKEEKLALLVQGNPTSEIFIIYLHGGPGGTSALTIKNDYFKEIETRFQVAYYDQRSSGLSIGQSPDSLLTLNQFVDDLDVIVDYIYEKYAAKHVILMGHSWGATVGTKYLLDQKRQNKILAWIEIDGGHNLGPHAFDLSKAFILNRIDLDLLPKAQYINETREWMRIKDFYTHLESWRNTKDISSHSNHLYLVGGYYRKISNKRNLTIYDLIFSDINYISLYFKNKYLAKKMDVWHYDFTKKLENIKIPVLLLWGRHDGIFPVQLAYEAKEKLNIPDSQFHIFESSAHSPHIEETKLFNHKVIHFIDSLSVSTKNKLY